MTTFEFSGLVRVAKFIVDQADRLDVNRGALLRDGGIAPSVLEHPDRRMPVDRIWTVWQLLLTRTEDPDVGIRIGQAASVREFGLVGYSMLHSATLRDALRRLVRYSPILVDALGFEMQEGSTRAELVASRNPGLDSARQRTDACLAGILTACREIAAAPITPVEVWLNYERPANTAAHKRFFGAPLRFGKDRGGLVLRNEDLDLETALGDATLCSYLDRLARSNMDSLGRRDSFRDEVRRAMWIELSEGPPDLQRTAAALGVSVRTLQRRLRHEGTSFSAALDQMRQQAADRLLSDRSLSVSQIASLLGYSEPSTFYRAFRRWRGVSPEEFRRADD